MNWFLNFLNSTVGRKIVMSLTGLFLISFLLVHCTINSLMFLNDDGLCFNEAAHFMASNILIRTIEILLFVFLIIHILQSVAITRQNMKARTISYSGTSTTATSKWYSRSMGILGSLILVFLVIHLKDFFIPSRFTDQVGLDNNGNPDMYSIVKEAFQSNGYAMIYVFSMIVLAYHLLHGFQSAFRSLGIYHKKYTPVVEFLGIAFSIIVPAVFAAMPIFFLLKK